MAKEHTHTHKAMAYFHSDYFYFDALNIRTESETEMERLTWKKASE